MRRLMRRFVRARPGATPLQLALAIVLVGAAACGSQETELAIATEVVDEWIAAWNADDPNAVANAFTANAVYHDFDEEWRGRESILDHAHYFNDIILELRRIGKGRATDGGTFVFLLSFDFDFGSRAGTDVGEVEIAITDRLMSRVEWLNREQVE